MTRTALVLHGGGGPATVAGLAAHLAGPAASASEGAAAHGFGVVAPTHPGWEGTASVPGDTIGALAGRYLDDLAGRGVHDAVIVGSSVGGWIAAEIAVQDARRQPADRVVGALVLIDAVGIDVSGEPIRDFFALDPRGVAEYAWSDPARGYLDPATLSPARLALMRGNMASLRAYAGDPYMHDRTLLARLEAIAAPTLVLWGDADRIVTPAYGRAFAAAIPDARLEVIASAGHLPHLEQPDRTFAVLDAFLAG